MSSNFFLPLTGKEDNQRLDMKYKALLESDDEEEENESQNKRGKGKISEWTIDDGASTSQWLHSPSKKNKINLHMKHPSHNSKARRQLQSPKQCVVTTSKKKDIPLKTGTKANISSRNNKGNESGEHQPKPLHTNSSNDELLDDRNRTRKQSGEKNCVDMDNARTLNFSFQTSSEGFSTVDTERPKLSVRPQAAKIDFQLSQDWEEPVVKVPACLNQYLRDYQRDGIRFLYQHYVQGKGAILGDDMGLGKTIQVIGFLSALLGKNGNHTDTARALPKFIRQLSDEVSASPPRVATKPFLIVGPACVLMNWLEEFNTWGYFTTGKFHGSEREKCLSDVKKDKLEVVVTTFETFRDSVDRLCEIEWEGIIVDEVHKIKEPKAQISKALNQITTLCRYGLTGTALQNNMVDLWSILDWAQPGILGSLDKFNYRYRYAIEMGQRHDASKRDLALARKQKDKFAEIRKKLMLRRTKALIADQLPSKEDNVVMCRLTDLQVAVYKAILNHPDTTLVLQAEDPCDCGKKKLKASCCYKYTKGKVKVWSLVLSFMHLILKAANHCALLIPDSSGKTSRLQAKHAQEVCNEALKDFPQFVQQTRDAAFLTLSDPKYCGKMKILQGLLSVFSSTHDKVLVFSYSTRLLDIIENYVISQCFEYRRIDGKTSIQKRMEIVHQFNKDADIFLCLISTKAGGLGLNLTGANRVVIFDPNWNPSHDLQAQDRAYRIGQTRDVKVYRLVSAGTIEENIYLRQIYKQQLDEVAVSTSNAKRYFHGIQGDKWSRGELFGVKNMFTLRTSDTCLTMDILKRNERLEKDLSGYDITRYIPPSKEAEKDENDDDSDDSGGSVVDNNVEDSREEEKEEEEEDEEDILLQALFGKDRILDKKIRKSTSSFSKVASTSSHDKTTASSSVQSDVDSNTSHDDDEDDFFLPKIHSMAKRERKSREFSEEESSEKDVFTVDDITFPRSTFNTIKTQQRAESSKSEGEKCHLNNWKPSPGISWLFLSDDENDDIEDGDNNNKEEENAKADKDHISEKMKSHEKTASMLSRLFPDSDDNVDYNDEYHVEIKDRLNETECKEQSKTSDQSKKKAGTVREINENKPSTSRIRHAKTRTGKETTPKKVKTSKSDFDSVKAVFEQCGVLHIHGNKEVIGSSRAEDHMTRCAMQEVFDLKTNTQMPAMQCDPLPQEAEEEPKIKKRKNKKDPPDHNAPFSTKVGSVKILLGQTPPGVQRQAWGELCQFMGEDQLSLAQRLVTCGPEERLGVLRDFYTQKHPKLADSLGTLLTIRSADDSITSTKGPQPSKEDKTSTNLRGKTSPSKSSHAQPNASATTHKAFTSTSRNKRNVRKRPPASTLTGQTLLDTQSQDSLTAHTPPAQDPSLSPTEDNDRFSPVPPKRRPPSASSSKSVTTRIRQKALNKAARLQLFKKPSDRKGVTYEGSGDDDDDGGDLVSVSCDDGYNRDGININDRLDFGISLMHSSEDIPSLLFEMGGQTSAMQRKESKNVKSYSRIDTNNDPTTSNNIMLNTETEAYNIYSCSATSSQRKVTHKTSNEKITRNPRRDYASILDDIFDKTLDTAASGDGANVKVNEIHSAQTDLQTKNVNKKQSPNHHSHISRSDFVHGEEEPSTSGYNTRLPHNDRSSSRCKDLDGIGSVEIVDGSDSDNCDEIDGLFMNSTLKEDSPKKRRTFYTSPGKGKRKKKGPSPRRKVHEMEIMEESAGSSQSLFS